MSLKRSPLDFAITDGRRTLEEQARLVAGGASKTMRSRHLTGHAIDFVPLRGGKASWEHEDFRIVADTFKSVATELKIPIRWGWGLEELS